jgi:4-diphosphocytidyl-2-C-methyl-D-erythritol kinase
VSDSITFKSPAKVNYYLKVGEKLSNGYHKIATVMCAVSIYDQITLTFEGKGIKIESNDPEVPTGSSNTVFRAAQILLKEAKIAQDDIGIKVAIQKNIPIEAGLGGASSNAASIILKLNEQLNLGLPLEKLLTIGNEVGSDVPFFIFGSPALVTGVGEKVEAIDGIPEAWVVIVKPPGSVSTKLAYKKIDLGLTSIKKSIIIPKFNNTLKDLADKMENDFESVVEAGTNSNTIVSEKESIHLPDVGKIKKELEKLGSLKAMLSGSGSSVFGIFENRDDAEIASKKIRSNQDWSVFLAQGLSYNNVAN